MKNHIAGWVRNTDHGTVEIMATALPADIEILIMYCKKGPPAALVNHVEILWQEELSVFDGFQIHR